MSRGVGRTRRPKGSAEEGLARTPLGADAFAERVMAAVRQEASPTPARTFMSALQSRSARDASSALWVAWHLGTIRRWHVAPGVRARSIALVLAVACALVSGSLATAAAVRVAAEPVVQLLQSGVDQPVGNRPLDIDEQGPGDQNPAVPRGQEAGDATDNTQSGADEQGADEADVDEAGSDGLNGDDATDDDSATDDANDDDAADDGDEADSATDDANDEDADGDESATDETNEDAGSDESDTDDSGEAAEDGSTERDEADEAQDAEDEPSGDD